ncbi:MAG TPA: hypothetical protein VG709_08145, partial [Actinomycetota bacterium]|nr:hypothetical protein [Actinomycetota bacterium]
SWGKFRPPASASRFSTLLLVTLLGASAFALTTVDPIKITIYAVYLGAATLPITYGSILVVANDRRYMGSLANGRLGNTIASIYLVLLTAVALAAFPLLLITKGGA